MFESLFRGKTVKGEGSPQSERKNLTLNEFFDRYFFPHIEIKKKNPHYDWLAYNKLFRKTLGEKLLIELDNLALDAWVHSHIKSHYLPSTINKHIFFMNRMLNLACHWGFLDQNTFRDRKIRRLKMGDYKQRFLNRDEVIRLLNACRSDLHPFLYVFVKLLILTGARKGEARMAKWKDIDLAKRVWTVPVAKGGRSRRIVLSHAALETLEEIEAISLRIGLPVQRDNYVFINPETMTAYHSFHAGWYRAREKAALPTVRIHDLRHTFASMLINNGATIYEVQKLLGHYHVSMTERYAHLFPDTLHDCVEIMSEKLTHIDLRNRTEDAIEAATGAVIDQGRLGDQRE